MNSRYQKATSVREKLQNLSLRVVESDPWVPIRFIVKGEPREFKMEFSYGAVLEVFRATGLNINLNDFGPEELNNPTLLPQLILAGIRTYHEDEFPEGDEGLKRLTRMMNLRHRVYYQACVQRAFDAIQPDITEIEEVLGELDKKDEVGEPAAPLAVVGTSSDSGASAEISDVPNLKYDE